MSQLSHQKRYWFIDKLKDFFEFSDLGYFFKGDKDALASEAELANVDVIFFNKFLQSDILIQFVERGQDINACEAQLRKSLEAIKNSYSSSKRKDPVGVLLHVEEVEGNEPKLISIRENLAEANLSEKLEKILNVKQIQRLVYISNSNFREG